MGRGLLDQKTRGPEDQDPAGGCSSGEKSEMFHANTFLNPTRVKTAWVCEGGGARQVDVGGDRAQTHSVDGGENSFQRGVGKGKPAQIGGERGRGGGVWVVGD